IASANRIRVCHDCRGVFINTFCMPEKWWSNYLQNSNGYFGCEATQDTDTVTGINTWGFFQSKHLKLDLNYDWSKINIFSRWIKDKATNKTKTGIIVFDPTEQINYENFQTQTEANTQDPFWAWPQILHEATNFQDSAVWGIRDVVRKIEKQDRPEGRPGPDYRRLHDIARHAIHVTESLDVAVQTLEQILRQHQCYTGSIAGIPSQQHPNIPTDIQSQLGFSQSCLNSLRHRSISNEKRLQNEIQLAFNTVAQHDASVTVKISQAMMSDNTALKTLAFVTFIFLPPTFISSIFSMAFFDFSPDSGFTVSKDMWIYWAFAIPTTLLTGVMWQYWHKFAPRKQVQRRLQSFHGVKSQKLPKSEV
ncbi:hypothetical protein N7532_010070, partial [Penicillium argentinense]